MSDHPSKTLPDLTQGWPDDPGNDDLARLGQDLFAGRAELPQIALDRIQIRMRQEMNRPWWQRRWRTMIASIVGIVALALGVYCWIAMSNPHTSPRDNTGRQPENPAVQDRYQVTLPPSSPKPPEKPVIDLPRYNDLFQREGKDLKR